MATSGYGTIKEFDPHGGNSIATYLDQVDFYFVANDIVDAKKVPILLASIGSTTYALLSDLLAPTPPKDKTYKEITDALRGHFEPKRLIIAERFHFHKRKQIIGESISDFDAALRKLAVHCKFGDNLEDTLRDRFVCGLQQDSIQRRLLSEPALTYAKGLEIAKGMEAADKDSKSFKPDMSNQATLKKLNHTLPTPSSSNLHPSPCSNPGNRHLCYRCGKTNHSAAMCRFKDAQCRACGKTGHIAPVCRSKPLAKPRQKVKEKTHCVHCSDNHTDEDDSNLSGSDEFKLHKINRKTPTGPITVSLQLNDQPLNMEVDTGAALSIISESTRKKFFPSEVLHPTDVVLTTYTYEQIIVKGTLHVEVKYGKQSEKLKLVVVDGDGPSLMGRNWLKYIRLDWNSILAIKAAQMKPLNSVLQEYQTVFTNELGRIKPFTISLQVDSKVTPRFYKPRPVPYAIRDAVGLELDRLEREGVISPVDHSQWAAPIVVVPKKDRTFRICGDYKVTINQALIPDEYPLPTPEGLYALLAEGKVFSKLDLSQAYLQLPIEEESRPLLTINTHKGLYVYNRMPFGITSAPAVFQKIMDTVLQGIAGVTCYIDDILICSADNETHLKTLAEVLKRLQKHGFRLKVEKCEFMVDSIEYLGHVVSKEGVRPITGKVEAIVNAPEPTNVSQLRSFLGLTNYYGKFIPNLSTLLRPLNQLLQAKHTWNWTGECTRVFREVKTQIASGRVLTHYNPKLPITLAADASAYGVGAVISHILPDSTERPIAFASRTLTTSEKNYAQLEKEALALVFGVKRFHQYLYGREFILVTDHKPLTTILSPSKSIPTLAAARLQRWAMLLAAYRYKIQFKSTSQHGNADGLSRLPLPDVSTELDETAVTTFNIGQLQSVPVTFREIQTATRQDPLLGKVCRFIQEGWPGQIPDELKLFKNRFMELSIERGVILWGIRVVIPTKLRSRVLQSLHLNHPGITRMKTIARSHFWWKDLDKEIELLGQSCSICQQNQANPAPAPLHPWIWPDRPWRRIHVDFAGPFLGHMFIIIVDAYSKWPEVEVMSSTTTPKTLEVLRTVFARHGLPDQLVTDNGPQFVSGEFASFLKANGIKHVLSPPYHPSSNGLAERFVQTMKRKLKAGVADGKSIKHSLVEFLFEYRATAHATTNEAPSELFLKRKLRTRFDLLHPDTRGFVATKQAQQCQNNSRRTLREFLPGSLVYVRNYAGPTKWIPGVVLSKLGPVTYQVAVETGRSMKRHIDQLRSRVCTPGKSSKVSDFKEVDYYHYPGDHETEIEDVQQEPNSEQRYPRRFRHPPDRLTF